MFAAQNDQENFVHGHQQAAASKPLNQGTRGPLPKTPGNKYPKTPLRVPLNDENATTTYGKGVFGTKGKANGNLMNSGKNGPTLGKNAFVTPMANRAPLGMKTTNAKTKGFRTPGPLDDKDSNRSQPIPNSSVRRPKKVSHAETTKLEIHGDDGGPLDVPDVEYAPPRPAELPYESDVFPDGCLNYDVLKGKNLMRGWQQHFSNPVDENGVSKKQKEYDEAMTKALKEGEAKILKSMEEQDWSIGDVPETWPDYKQPKKVSSALERKPPSTINARKAATALSIPSRPTTAMSKTTVTAPKPKLPTSFVRTKKPTIPLPKEATTMRHNAAVATSRTTIGYNKGRATSAAIRPPLNSKPIISRTASNVSVSSSQNATITPALFAKKQQAQDESHLAFLKAFDREDDESNDSLGGSGGLPKCLEDADEDEEEEFVMTLTLR